MELGVDEFQFAFPRGVWFTRLCEVDDGYSLVGASVAPGFDFQVHTRTLYSIQGGQNVRIVRIFYNPNIFRIVRIFFFESARIVRICSL